MMGRSAEVVVVTGASAGVGRATAIAFARRGAKVALLARSETGLADALGDVHDAGGSGRIYVVDVSDARRVEECAQQIEEELGPIDVWVNNAMVSVFSPIKEMKPEEYKRVTDVTYLGYVYGTLSALKRMLPRDRGKIIMVGSALAYRSIPLQSAYCAAKHAIHGFTESLRTELIHDKSNVSVTEVQLPAVNTPQFRWVKSRLEGKAQPVPPIFEPEVIAEAIYWAAHHGRDELYLGASAVKAIVGDKIAPTFADHYLARYGYSGQQLDEPEDPNRPDNLWHPVEGLHSTRGDFTKRAHSWSPHILLNLQRRWVAGGLVAGLVGAKLLHDRRQERVAH